MMVIVVKVKVILMGVKMVKDDEVRGDGEGREGMAIMVMKVKGMTEVLN